MVGTAQLLVELLVVLVLWQGTHCVGASVETADGGVVRRWMAGRDVAVAAEPPPWDPKGYVIAFACQGRFGNQFDYLLGTLDYAKQIDRTLVLVRATAYIHSAFRSNGSALDTAPTPRLCVARVQAPWVDYNARKGTGQYPWFPWFKEYFSVEELQRYHDGRVIDMADFLYHYRERWSEVGVVGFCGYRKKDDTSDDCMAYSVPKGPFWRNLNVSFDPGKIRTVNRRDIHAVRKHGCMQSAALVRLLIVLMIASNTRRAETSCSCARYGA